MSIHKIVYFISTFAIILLLLGIIYSYDSQSAILLAGLFFIRFIAYELHVYEIKKKDDELINEIEMMLQAEEDLTYKQLKNKITKQIDTKK